MWLKENELDNQTLPFYRCALVLIGLLFYCRKCIVMAGTLGLPLQMWPRALSTATYNGSEGSWRCPAEHIESLSKAI